MHSALLLPSPEAAVILQSPAPTALTRPLLSTVATLLSELVQVTVLLEALEGLTVALKEALLPKSRDRLVLLMEREVLRTLPDTVTVQEAFAFVLAVLTAVIVALPAFRPLTFPLLSRVATVLLEVVQVMPYFVVLEDWKVAFSCTVPLISTLAVEGRVRPVGITSVWKPTPRSI